MTEDEHQKRLWETIVGPKPLRSLSFCSHLKMYYRELRSFSERSLNVHTGEENGKSHYR